MGAPIEYYCDFSAGNDTTGDGLSDATAWKTVQKALDTITRNTTHGDRINVKSTTPELLGTALTGATYGNGAVLAPLIIQGYTATAGDGGIGVISGNASVACVNDSARQFWIFRDLQFTNCAANQIVFMGANCTFWNVKFDTGTGGGLRSTSGSRIRGCRFENLGGTSLRASSNHVSGCYFKNGANVAATFLAQEGAGGSAHDNIFNASGATDCINQSQTCDIIRNRFYSSAGTGQAIIAGASSIMLGRIEYNYIEGFSGSGGKGIQATAGVNPDIISLIKNYYFNNETDKDLGGDTFISDDGTTLSGSAYVDPSTEDFSYNDTAGAGAVLRAVERILVA